MNNKVLFIQSPEESVQIAFDISSVLKLALAQKGYDLQVNITQSLKYTSEEVRAFCEQSKPDVVIVDNSYLAEDIFAFCYNMKNDPATANIGLFILSSYKDIRADKKWRESWFFLADEYMTKPFDIVEFERRLEDVIRKHRR